MDQSELLKILIRGEDSCHQFKRDATNADGLAAELAAFANSGGGWLFLGVNDDGSIAGLDGAAVKRLNQLLGNAASQHVRPPVHPLTENVQTDRGIVIAMEIPDGLAKPYLDNQGRIWVKQGSDKRHVTSREEMQRMFQRSGLVYADVVPVAGTSVEDIDGKAFTTYFNHRYDQASEYAGLTREQLLENIGLGDGQELNLAGLMLFGRNPQRWRPGTEWQSEASPPQEPPPSHPTSHRGSRTAINGNPGGDETRRTPGSAGAEGPEELQRKLPAPGAGYGPRGENNTRQTPEQPSEVPFDGCRSTLGKTSRQADLRLYPH